MKRLLSVVIVLSLPIILLTTAYATNLKTAVVLHSANPATDANQYKLTINKGNHVTGTHVEILPNEEGEYWIPNGYKVRVTADCDEGYEQETATEIYTLNEAKTVNLGAIEAPPPSKVDELEARIKKLEDNQNQKWELLAWAGGTSDKTVSLDIKVDDYECFCLKGFQAWEDNGKVYYNSTVQSDYYYPDIKDTNTSEIALWLQQNHGAYKGYFFVAEVLFNKTTRKLYSLIYQNRWDNPLSVHGTVLLGKKKVK